MLAVPSVKQRTESSCGPACLRSVLLFHGCPPAREAKRVLTRYYRPLPGVVARPWSGMWSGAPSDLQIACAVRACCAVSPGLRCVPLKLSRLVSTIVPYGGQGAR